MINTNLRRRQRRGTAPKRDGVAIVEFAVIANLLFLCVFTCIEFARVNMVRNLAQDAAYFAARVAMVPGATSQEAEAEVHRLLGSLTATGYTVQVDDLDSDSEEVRVTVAVDLDEVALFTPMFFRNRTITTSAVVRAERYNGFYRNN